MTSHSPIAKLPLILAICLTLAYTIQGYGFYTGYLPNGKNVPLYPALGHFNIEGKGPRNCFGKDFKNASRKWSVDLCQKDSDGDGMTNGEELGDALCKWTQANPTPLRTTNLTHPGICTPEDSEICKHFNSETTNCQMPTATTPNTTQPMPEATSPSLESTTASASHSVVDFLSCGLVILVAKLL